MLLRGDEMPIKLRVKEVATEKGWTQTKLQRAADVHPRTMSGIWHDPYRDVAHSTLVKIAKVLGVDISELTEEVTDTKE
jgi:DNA-binding Xre family transcriptional regulator